MPYADGPSGSESAKDWLKKNNVRFGTRPPATDQVNDFFGSLGKLKINGPSSKNWLGSISYEGPQKKAPITTLPSKKTKFTGWPAGRLSTQQGNTKPRNQDDQRDAAMSRRMQNQGVPPQEGPDTSFFDQLMGEFQSQWGGVDKSKIDYSPLDNALKARMDAINGIRTQSNDNFRQSDGNLEGMHNAFQNHIQTDGAQKFNQIHDTEKANLTDINQGAQSRLQAIKAEDMAKRQAMLQNLGIEESGAAPDTSADVLTQTQGSIANRNEAEMVNAEQDRASSLAFNQGMAQSVGQQGVERRAALHQQLQSILGKLGMAEADAQGENAQQRYELEQNQGNQQYQQYRDRQGFLQDTLGMLQDDAQKQAELAQKGGDPLEVSGFSGLAQDLLNTGYDTPEIQNAMGQLAEVTATDYMKGVDPNAGYSQSAILNKILQQRGIDPMLAIQLATNYGNLGNTSKYTQQ